jgi:integrase
MESKKKYPRQKTGYPGIFYREVERVGGKGKEKVFYALFRKGGELHEERVGAQYRDKMTEAKAARIRSDFIEGRRLLRKELKEQEEQAKEKRWTIERLFEEYKRVHPVKDPAQNESNFRNWLKEPFAEKEPHELSPFDIDRIKIQMKKANKKPQTIKNVLALLRGIINFSAKRGIIQGLPFKIEPPRNINNQVTEFLTPEQLRALFKAIEEDTYSQAGAIMKLALFTGMRRGEILKLQWANIDFERDFISLEDVKGGTDQKIPINIETRELLEGLLAACKGPNPYVFPGRKGLHRTALYNACKKIADKAGLPKTFRPLHGLRHTYASMLASSGEIDIYSLQKLLTHKDPKVTQRYAHLSDDALKRGADLAGSLVKQALQKKPKAEVIQLKRENEAQ